MFPSFEFPFLDCPVVERATNCALNPIERFWPDSDFARLDFRDRPRMQSTTRGELVLANPAFGSFPAEVCAERFPQRFSCEAMA